MLGGWAAAYRLSILGVRGLRAPVLDGRPWVVPPLIGDGFGIGWGGSGKPTIGGARDDVRREDECDEWVLRGRLVGGAIIWELDGEKNGVGGMERENGPPWASSLRRVRLNTARASRALSSSAVR